MNSLKNVLIISSPDINNASGVIAFDLHTSLLKMGLISQLLLKHSNSNEGGIVSFLSNSKNRYLNYKLKINSKISRKLTDKNYYFFDFDLTKKLLNIKSVTKKISPPDIIISLFMGGFFNIHDLYNLQKQFNGIPVILIMADQVYLTGGCHYVWSCNGFTKTCEFCPAITNLKHRNQAKKNLLYNKSFIEKMDVSLVALSKQDYLLAKKSTLWKQKKINKILLGINLEVFNLKKDKFLLRRKYNIYENDFVILYGAVSVAEKRKGAKYFIKAIENLSKRNNADNISLLLIGKGDIKDELLKMPYKVFSLGYISSYSELAEIYNLASVFVTTTIQDSGPMMINQSIACGTPVVSFDIGVAQDIVINGKTGFKTEIYNSDGIAESIYKIYKMDKENYLTMQKNCVSIAEEKFSKEKFAENILNIIRK